MKIEFTEHLIHDNRSGIMVSHDNKSIVFHDVVPRRFQSVQTTDPFKEINAHWARRSEKDQIQLYSLYKGANLLVWAYTQLEDNVEAAETILITSLRPYFARILNMHHLPGVRAFLDNFYHDNVPSDILDVLPENLTTEQAYTRDQYRMLQAALVILRSVAPLTWVVKNAVKRNVKAPDMNDVLYRILYGKAVDLMVSEPLQKLESYVKACVYYFNRKIDTDMNLDSLLANLLLNRLFAIDITGTHKNLISNIAVYVSQTIQLNGFYNQR